jgi:DNA-binding transcriptional regulator YdaS (Cro superfamily)
MKIIDALRAANKHQSKFAKELGIHPVYLNSIIKGRRKPSALLARRISIATGGIVTEMELLYPEQKENEL